MNVTGTQDAPTGAVTINDTTPTKDQVLTADAETVDDADGLGPLQYQWQRSVQGGWVDITGANQAIYTPGDADVGVSLRVTVSYTDGLGKPETVTSDATAAVSGGNRSPTVTASAPSHQLIEAGAPGALARRPRSSR